MFHARLKQMRLLTLLFLSGILFTACGQIGALYLPTYPKPATVSQIKPGSAPLEVNDPAYTPQAYESSSAIKSPPNPQPTYTIPPISYTASN